jgi:glutamate carboxypeptidase
MYDVPAPEQLERIRAHVEAALPAYLADLQQLVEIESGTYTKRGVDAVSTAMAVRLQALGAAVERHPHPEMGDTVVATFGGDDGPAVLLLGHADTVFEDGLIAEHPFEVRDGRAYGLGVCDMKSGLLVGLHALEALRACSDDEDGWLPVGRLTFVVNPDEEIGSPSSTAIIADQADGADASFVLEGGRANGDIVSARKGVLHARATLRGRAAHAGVEPEKGRSAVLEAAHKAVALDALNGRWDGVSVVVGALNGGTRPNIVPDRAEMQIDLRARTAIELTEARQALMDILELSTVPDVSTQVELSASWAPMERTPAAEALVQLARDISSHLGVDVADAATGGGSDANTTAALGVPTLDGLGPAGGGPHTPDEYIELESIVPRTTLLAGLLLSVGRAG